MTAGSGTVVITGDPLVMIDDFTNRAFFVTAPFATNALGTASGMPILWAVEVQGAAGSESFTVDDDFPTGGWDGVGWTIPPIGAGLAQFVMGTTATPTSNRTQGWRLPGAAPGSSTVTLRFRFSRVGDGGSDGDPTDGGIELFFQPSDPAMIILTIASTTGGTVEGLFRLTANTTVEIAKTDWGTPNDWWLLVTETTEDTLVRTKLYREDDGDPGWQLESDATGWGVNSGDIMFIARNRANQDVSGVVYMDYIATGAPSAMAATPVVITGR